ncbi:MAG TPA: hypothetical protein VNW52_12655, partial [Burkholderiaceae bacterium]|nr:hypothetical protein [Burkholderiaceae bacterium]
MGVLAVENGVIDTPNLFSGLDTPDCMALRIGSNLNIHGWLFSFDATIEAVYIACNGSRFIADYPIKRPHVGDAKGAWIDSTAAFPQNPYVTDVDCAIDPPYNFGFVTGPIPMDPAMGQRVDIDLIAVVNGHEFVVQSRTIQLLWSDPEEELFNLGAIAPFKSVVDFDQSQLLAYDDCAPVFLIGHDCAMQQALGALKGHNVTVPNASLFAQMRDAITTCYDAYFEFNLLYFNGLDNQKNGCAIKKFDIYGVLNTVVASFHQQRQEMHRSQFVHALIGEQGIELIPLLQAIYPRSVFIHIKTQAAANEQTAEHHLCAKMRVLKNGRAQLAVQEVELDGDAANNMHAFGHVADLIRQSRSTVDRNIEQSVASKNIPGSLNPEAPQNYLHAVPVYSEHRPIFILGAGRSGTSALTAALMGADIAGFGEGHVFPLINEIARRLWKLE